MGYLFWLVARAQVRAQTCDARQWIAVIMEMFFDFLIVNLAQKAEKIQLLENQKIFKKARKFSKFSKFQIFSIFLLIFSTFKFMDLHRS